jgi:hypothetical protein
MKNIGFVILCEPGELEWQTVLLVASIKAFVRDSYNIHIYCRSEKKESLDPRTLKFLDDNGLALNLIKNNYAPEYPHGNKIIACAEKREEVYTVFLDTDTAFVRPVTLMDYLNEDRVTVSAAGYKTWTKENKDWFYLYDKFQLDCPNKLVVLKNNELSLPYFNAGFIGFYNKSNFSDNWLEISNSIDADSSVLNKRPWLDQIALPIAINYTGLNIYDLKINMNYSINNDLGLPSDLIHVHYHHPMYIYRKELNKHMSALLTCVDTQFKNFFDLSKFHEKN